MGVSQVVPTSVLVAIATTACISCSARTLHTVTCRSEKWLGHFCCTAKVPANMFASLLLCVYEHVAGYARLRGDGRCVFCRPGRCAGQFWWGSMIAAGNFVILTVCYDSTVQMVNACWLCMLATHTMLFGYTANYQCVYAHGLQ
eukprot:GHRR01016545.1.p1 GENE.GHRR01016545.1~~GHRR01016545.1.p1  ORF type:complete len:144 (+),score=31.59 GHRR01016545.1:2197-2628(+)